MRNRKDLEAWAAPEHRVVLNTGKAHNHLAQGPNWPQHASGSRTIGRPRGFVNHRAGPARAEEDQTAIPSDLITGSFDRILAASNAKAGFQRRRFRGELRGLVPMVSCNTQPAKFRKGEMCIPQGGRGKNHEHEDGLGGIGNDPGNPALPGVWAS